MNSLLSRKSCNLWCYSFWKSIISIVRIISINVKAQRGCPTLKFKTRNRCLSWKSNTRRTHYYSFYWHGHSKILCIQLQHTFEPTCRLQRGRTV